MSLKGKHMVTHHNHRGLGKELAPQTRGRIITWAWLYDRMVSFLTLGRERAMRRMTVDLARLQAGEKVLEVGCGTGAVSIVAKERVGASGQVHGIDPAPQMIAAARNKVARRELAIDFQVGLIEQLAFPDDSFDVVLSSLMMHHLPADLKRQGLAEIARILKPGGRLLIVDFKRPEQRKQGSVGKHGSIRDLPALLLHVSKLNSGIQDLPALMKEAGFAPVESGETGFRTLGFALGRISKAQAEES
jgi:ubiquinone/menaquinone biosynthesis C-methylase UbiE